MSFVMRQIIPTIDIMNENQITVFFSNFTLTPAFQLCGIFRHNISKCNKQIQHAIDAHFSTSDNTIQ